MVLITEAACNTALQTPTAGLLSRDCEQSVRGHLQIAALGDRFILIFKKAREKRNLSYKFAAGVYECWVCVLERWCDRAEWLPQPGVRSGSCYLSGTDCGTGTTIGVAEREEHSVLSLHPHLACSLVKKAAAGPVISGCASSGEGGN